MVIGCYPKGLATALGRDGSFASGSFRASKRQRRLSGDETDEAAVTTRPQAVIWISLKLPFMHAGLL